MTNFTITFGTGKDKVNVELAGNDLLEVLNDLKSSGWKIEDITKVKKDS